MPFYTREKPEWLKGLTAPVLTCKSGGGGKTGAQSARRRGKGFTWGSLGFRGGRKLVGPIQQAWKKGELLSRRKQGGGRREGGLSPEERQISDGVVSSKRFGECDGGVKKGTAGLEWKRLWSFKPEPKI